MSPGFLAAGPFGFLRKLTSRPDVGMGTSRLSRWAWAQGCAKLEGGRAGTGLLAGLRAARLRAAEARGGGGSGREFRGGEFRGGGGALRTRQHDPLAVESSLQPLHLPVELARLCLGRDLGL